MKRSLEERLERLEPLFQEPPPSTVRGKTLGEFFREVGMITHLAYPVRRLEQIGADSRFPEVCRYEHAVGQAKVDATSENRKEEGRRLMAQLLIEPFAAIHEMLKEDENHDDV